MVIVWHSHITKIDILSMKYSLEDNYNSQSSEDGLSCGTQKVSEEHAIVSADITIDKQRIVTGCI